MRKLAFRISLPPLLALLFFLTGCATSPHLVTSRHNLADNQLKGATIYIESATANTGFKDEQEAFYRSLIAAALRRNGLVPVPRANEADYTLAYLYGLSRPSNSGYYVSSGMVMPLTDYPHHLDARIYAKGEKQHIWECNVTAVWGHPDLTKSMPGMIEEMFKIFPGQSGVRREAWH